MLNSTATPSCGWRVASEDSRRASSLATRHPPPATLLLDWPLHLLPGLRQGLAALGDLDHEHDQQHPDGGGVDGDLGEGVAGPRAEGAAAAGAAQRAGQPAAL